MSRLRHRRDRPAHRVRRPRDVRRRPARVGRPGRLNRGFAVAGFADIAVVERPLFEQRERALGAERSSATRPETTPSRRSRRTDRGADAAGPIHTTGSGVCKCAAPPRAVGPVVVRFEGGTGVCRCPLEVSVWPSARRLQGVVISMVRSLLAGGVLDVDPGPTLVGRVEVEAGELRAEGAVGRPAADALAGVGQVAVVVEVVGEPDVVVDAAVAVLDDVDVAVVVDGQVVGAGAAPRRRAGRWPGRWWCGRRRPRWSGRRGRARRPRWWWSWST